MAEAPSAMIRSVAARWRNDRGIEIGAQRARFARRLLSGVRVARDDAANVDRVAIGDVAGAARLVAG
jgi:hypothetical protein